LGVDWLYLPLLLLVEKEGQILGQILTAAAGEGRARRTRAHRVVEVGAATVGTVHVGAAQAAQIGGGAHVGGGTHVGGGAHAGSAPVGAGHVGATHVTAGGIGRGVVWLQDKHSQLLLLSKLPSPEK
jgi:hypothetical protein